jgi:uncharacterized membrane protein
MPLFNYVRRNIMQTQADWITLFVMIGVVTFMVFGAIGAMWLASTHVLKAQAKDRGMTYDEYLAYLKKQRR